jgi:hypothetical protein
MIRKYIATLRVEVEAQSTEARDDVLYRLCDRINKKPPSILYDDVGLGAVKNSVRVTRVRPARGRSKKK